MTTSRNEAGFIVRLPWVVGVEKDGVLVVLLTAAKTATAFTVWQK